MGGTANVLAQRPCQELGSKVRGIELSSPARSGSHITSGVDIIDEAFLAGQKPSAVLAGATDDRV